MRIKCFDEEMDISKIQKLGTQDLKPRRIYQGKILSNGKWMTIIIIIIIILIIIINPMK
jgi:hypothetical protein